MMCKLLRIGILITFGVLIICIISGCGKDDPPEKVVDPPQSEHRVQPPPATKVEVDPAPGGGSLYSNTVFTLKFNQEVVAAWLNDTPAIGSGLVWKASPPLWTGPGQTLNIKWVNQDGSTDTIKVGPYTIEDNGGELPEITSVQWQMGMRMSTLRQSMPVASGSILMKMLQAPLT